MATITPPARAIPSGPIRSPIRLSRLLDQAGPSAANPSACNITTWSTITMPPPNSTMATGPTTAPAPLPTRTPTPTAIRGTGPYSVSGITGTASLSGAKNDSAAHHRLQPDLKWQVGGGRRPQRVLRQRLHRLVLLDQRAYAHSGTGWSTSGTQSSGAGNDTSYDYDTTADYDENGNCTSLDGHTSRSYGNYTRLILFRHQWYIFPLRQWRNCDRHSHRHGRATTATATRRNLCLLQRYMERTDANQDSDRQQ